VTHPIYWDPNDPMSESSFRGPYDASHGGGWGGIGDIILGTIGTGIEGLIQYGVGNLPMRRPPTLPPAGRPPSLPPAGVPYPRTGGMSRPGIGPQIPRISGAAKAAAIAAGAYQVGRWLYDAAGNLLGQTRRHPRMNVCNPRALRRSMRRVTGFAMVARRAISFTRRVKMKKGAFKKGKACR
jgi:hypothetical protein